MTVKKSTGDSRARVNEQVLEGTVQTPTLAESVLRQGNGPLQAQTIISDSADERSKGSGKNTVNQSWFLLTNSLTPPLG